MRDCGKQPISGYVRDSDWAIIFAEHLVEIIEYLSFKASPLQ